VRRHATSFICAGSALFAGPSPFASTPPSVFASQLDRLPGLVRRLAVTASVRTDQVSRQEERITTLESGADAERRRHAERCLANAHLGYSPHDTSSLPVATSGAEQPSFGGYGGSLEVYEDSFGA
jgi:hypothetical protein